MYVYTILTIIFLLIFREFCIEDSIKNHKFRWRDIQPPNSTERFLGKQFENPPENFDELEPYNFFFFFGRMMQPNF